MTAPEVTICVPTYNRAACLRQLLDSIDEYAPRFPVLVSDNASTDGTAAVVRAFSEKDGRIAYHRRPRNIGAVANLLATVRLAGSEWVMLMGDDDVLHARLDIVPDAIAATGADALLLGRCDGDERLSFLRPWPYLMGSGPGTEPGWRVFSRPEALLASGLCLGAAFSFISGIVVRREAWLESIGQLKAGSAAERFSASLFPQSWIVLNLMTRGAVVCVIDKPLVMERHGNDRLCDNNILEHARIDVAEFTAIGEYISGHRPAALAAMQGLIRRHLRRHVFSKPGAAFYQRGKYGDKCWRDFRAVADRYMGPCQRLAPSLVPIGVLESAYSVYRKLKKTGRRNPPPR